MIAYHTPHTCAHTHAHAYIHREQRYTYVLLIVFLLLLKVKCDLFKVVQRCVRFFTLFAHVNFSLPFFYVCVCAFISMLFLARMYMFIFFPSFSAEMARTSHMAGCDLATIYILLLSQKCCSYSHACIFSCPKWHILKQPPLKRGWVVTSHVRYTKGV